MKRSRDHVDDARPSASAGQRAVFWVVFVALLAVFVPTGSLEYPLSPDPKTNALTAYLMAETGSVYAPDHGFVTSPDQQGTTLWLVEAPHGPVSRYPPGAALLAAPVYWLADATVGIDTFPVAVADADDVGQVVDLPDMWPAALVGSATAAAAMAFLGVALVRSGLRSSDAMVGCIVLGLSTSIWSVAANALWQHGPAALFLAWGLALLADDDLVPAGLAFSGAVLVRPQVAVGIAVLGVTVGFLQRSLDPVVRLGLSSGLGAALYLGYNLVIFGEVLPNLAGGYVVEGAFASVAPRLEAIVATLFDPYRGLLIHSPVIVVAIVATVSTFRNRRAWMIGGALGGLAYLLLQARPGDFAGGSDFWAYRYPIEGLMLAAPLFVCSVYDWIRSDPLRIAVTAIGIGVSIGLHAFGTIVMQL